VYLGIKEIHETLAGLITGVLLADRQLPDAADTEVPDLVVQEAPADERPMPSP